MDTYLIHFVYYASFKHESSGAPAKDKEWFKSYRIIPRVGDCVLKDGEWFQVERVFLYQPTAKGIDAQVQCSFYGFDTG
ncbi:MAG TPA: hypothetical protein DCZ55_03450 [Cyanobacteria bacterium UBA11371]|nr:hypothetical protein [Cyanobacteria bacterium UBA11371]